MNISLVKDGSNILILNFYLTFQNHDLKNYNVIFFHFQINKYILVFYLKRNIWYGYPNLPIYHKIQIFIYPNPNMMEIFEF
jgi:hypothetical protein